MYINYISYVHSLIIYHMYINKLYIICTLINYISYVH